MYTRSLLCLVLLSLSTTSAIAHHVQKSGMPTAPASTAPTVSLSGFVSETTIDNRVAGTSARVIVLHADDGSRSVLFGADTSSMRAGAAYVVTGRVTGHALFVESSRMTASTDARANRLASSAQVSVDGTLRLGHADNFDGGPSEFFYAIVSSNAQYRVSGATLVEGLENGVTGSVTGHVADDGELVADRIVIVAPASALPKATASAVTTSYIVLPVKFPTNAAAPFTYNADPFTVSSINTAVFGASNSVGHYYVETSYGQQALSGIVADNGAAGWLLAERALPATCDINVIATAAENAATARGYNLNNYAGRIYVFSNNVPGCGWSGLAYVGWPRSYIKQTTSLLVIGHEVGHNFGMLHAASLDCGANVIGGTCSSSEYGDPFDIMGNNRAMHMNAAQKFDLGWIAPGTVKTHATGRQTYTLTPIETAGGATYAVKIPAASNRTYWLEYRQPIGYDAALSSFPNNGAQFRVASPFESICPTCADDTEFLDMTPATSAFTDGALVLGQTYMDAVYGVQVSITSATPTALTIDVAVGPGGAAPGATYVTSSSNPSPTIIVTKSAVCPASGVLVVTATGESVAKSSFAGTAFIGLAYSIARNSVATDNSNVVQSSALATFNGDVNRDFLNVQRVDACTPGQSYSYALTGYATTPQTLTGAGTGSFVFNARIVAVGGPAHSNVATGSKIVASASNLSPTIVTSLAVVCPANGKVFVTGSGESASVSNAAGNAFIGLAYSIARDSTATDNGNVVQSSALSRFNGDANRDFLNVGRHDTCTPGATNTYNLTAYATTAQTSTSNSFVYNGRLTAFEMNTTSNVLPGAQFATTTTNAVPTLLNTLNVVCPASGMSIVTASGEAASLSTAAGTAFIGLAYSIARDGVATDNANVVQSSALASFSGDVNRDFLSLQRADTCTPGATNTFNLTVYPTTPQTGSVGQSFLWNGRLTAILP